MTVQCQICSAEIPSKSTRGRPRKFCSTACGRVAERKLKVLDRILNDLLKWDISTRDPHSFFSGPGEAARIQAEIKRVQTEMRDLS